MAQKTLVNDTTYKSWTAVDNGKISPDGCYSYYRIVNEPSNGSTWVILSTNKSWDFKSKALTELNFSPDSKYLYAMQSDSLVKLNLKSREITNIPHCKSYELYSNEIKSKLIYSLDDTLGSVIIEDLRSGLKWTLKNVQEYSVNKNGDAMVSKIKSEKSSIETIQWTDFSTGESLCIYKGNTSKNLIYDPSGNLLAFSSTNKEGETEIRCYKRGWKSSKLIASDISEGIAKNLKITLDDTWRFSADGKYLFFNLTEKTAIDKKIGEPDIWNYQDMLLLPQFKLIEASLHRGENLSRLELANGEILQLLSGSRKIMRSKFPSKNDSVLLVCAKHNFADESPWNKQARNSYYLCSTKTGRMIPIKEYCDSEPSFLELTPNRDYLLYFDVNINKYLSYNLKTGKTEIIGKLLKDELISLPLNARPGVYRSFTAGIVGFVGGTTKVVVKGKFDLWELDYSNRVDPINLTNYLGKQNNIIFSVFNESKNQILENNKDWLLLGFNFATKESSIYLLNRQSKGLKRLFVGSENLVQFSGEIRDVLFKAEKSNRFLMLAGNVENSPNYLFTKDFRQFDTLSNVHPEVKYNWIKSELATYTDKFGNQCQGIIYKPSNFNPNRKYPIIFNYYLESSNDLNSHLKPEPSLTGINIPLLASNGYIVFKPNIYFLSKKVPGESALTGVLAAVDYISQFKWADTARMGLIGHSYGGFETNYIVTHSNRFKAAVSGAGISNLIDFYNSWHEGVGSSNQNFTKFTFFSMGEGLETIPNDYIENSPIMSSKNLATPLLLMHNNGDASVNVFQSKWFFVQLRSLQKRVWFVQYENEGHALAQEQHQIDFQDKVKDFFDHYLKKQPLPQWMNSPIRY